MDTDRIDYAEARVDSTRLLEKFLRVALEAMIASHPWIKELLAISAEDGIDKGENWELPIIKICPPLGFEASSRQGGKKEERRILESTVERAKRLTQIHGKTWTERFWKKCGPGHEEDGLVRVGYRLHFSGREIKISLIHFYYEK